MTKKDETVSAESKYKMKAPSVTFIACLVIATVIWLFSTLSKEYTQTLEYRVSCYDLPANKQVATLSDSILNLRFTTRGFNFMHPKYSDNKLEIGLSVTTLTQNSTKRNVYTLNRRTLTEYIKTQPGFDGAFDEVVSPESITIYLK
ncbi:hypothetical protein LJC68_03810 [Bacteroidales bacterium OttesenSCG-928-B11]|nr:hypothetical protein [Bacteroidales bacterium OttesenSCG-928-E04]MDL2308787.1 hypothetical protein [Bacteroidales bacterium OttesenSCG-928-C03]MDL2311987.1 hypothetical protein [Bacteroidales bacterium OttesenSCG-928-B11]